LIYRLDDSFNRLNLLYVPLSSTTGVLKKFNIFLKK
jgi:hypothetical protein